MQLLIRDLVAADLPAVTALEAGEAGGWTAGQWTAELARAGGWRLVVLDSASGRVVGYIAGMVVGSEAEIFRLLVAPDYRRRRVATALLRRLWQLLPGLGAASCFLEVRAANKAALGLYTKMGFKRRGLRRDYYRDPVDDAVVMGCKIVAAMVPPGFPEVDDAGRRGPPAGKRGVRPAPGTS